MQRLPCLVLACLCRCAPAPLALVAVLATGLLLSGCATSRPTVQRGSLLRTVVEDLKSENLFEVVIPPGPSPCPHLQVFTFERVQCRNLEYYQKVLEYRADGERDPSKVRREPLTGQDLEVRGEARVEVRNRRPMALHAITVNGVQTTLDANGYFYDRQERFLSQFDGKPPADNAALEFAVVHPTRGTQTLSLTRRQLQENLGLSLEIPKNVSGDDLLLTTALKPEAPKPGEAVQITLTVTNTGRLPAARVEGRLFSRHGWLSGHYFYIGTLAAGQARSFTRTVTVPAAAGRAEARGFFAEIAVWDTSLRDKLGTLPHRAVPLHLVPVAPK